MLRRDFLKASSLVMGGMLILREMPNLEDRRNPGEGIRRFKPTYRFHGHLRSGCASPPELAPLVESGIMAMPF
ncbi:MAG: hypothetical protein JSU69_11725 [Candidatus Zixiibacteriota bacterium]|nr:MAG: hypothetical protein JSU69_11725 [candidate division Zixibacteria bacterium]